MRRNRRVVGLLVAVAVIATACARWRPEPMYLVFPDPPAISYRLCEQAGHPTPDVCLSQTDAAALAKWMDKVRAFEAARKRLTD